MVYGPSPPPGSDSLFVQPDWHVFAASTLLVIDGADPAKLAKQLTKQLAAHPNHRRIALESRAGKSWSESDVALPETLEALVVRGNKIQSLKRLRELPSLALLYLEEAKLLDDLGPVGALEHLQVLAIDGSKRIKDAAPLAANRALELLDLSGTGVSDLTPLTDLPTLEQLYFPNSVLRDFKAIGALRRLVHLRGWPTKVRDFSPLANLTSLRALSLAFAKQVKDLAPLGELTGLEELEFAYTDGDGCVTEFGPLAKLTRLKRLSLEFTEFHDASILRGLTELEYLHLGDTKVTDFTPLFDLPKVKKLLLPHMDPDAAIAIRKRVTGSEAL
jgi:Leucine-rich repeat (LRR) protein